MVLAGGGSRGAYEAGVIMYLREQFHKRLGYHAPIDIVTGTSVGAINGAFMASTMDDPVHQSHRIVEAWRSLRIEKLLALGAMDLWRGFRRVITNDVSPPAPGTYRYGGILDTTGLEKFVIQSIPWRNIRRNLHRRTLHALSVSATHVGSGHTVVFVQSSAGPPTVWSQDPFVRHRVAHVGPRHVLASAAIPMLFPAVKIGGEFYSDGGLRQNTPMSPAIRLGAQRLLVISLRHVASPEEQAMRAKEREEAYPKPLFLMGKALNALLLDHTEYDLDRLERFNAIIKAGQQAFGDGFLDVLNTKMVELRGAPLRLLEAVHIRPSIDIGEIASDYVTKGKVTVKSRVARKLIGRMAESEAVHENDLLSYLLFDGNYAAELIRLGYEDAARQEDELLAFFSQEGDGPDPS
ncbi:patatin-like phospholipase family protein [Haliangium sp.]|uniref:patatin-like phospholipase family protein n=1 Tax=Haliangium sp. TaxID=2663208 RepID=UPI003D134CC2